MSRERQFCEREVLNRVTALFAEHGYKGTSLSMLLEATGLGKQSLYNCFGDKRALYLRALDDAAARYAGLRDRMREAPTGRAGLAVYFHQLVLGCAGVEPEWRHCIVAGGLLEHLDDPLLRARLGESWGGAHELLREQVERGQRDGSITSPPPLGRARRPPPRRRRGPARERRRALLPRAPAPHRGPRLRHPRRAGTPRHLDRSVHHD